ncbi:MAG: AIR synthase-related protein [Nocardioides sp.]
MLPYTPLHAEPVEVGEGLLRRLLVEALDRKTHVHDDVLIDLHVGNVGQADVLAESAEVDFGHRGAVPLGDGHDAARNCQAHLLLLLLGVAVGAAGRAVADDVRRGVEVATIAATHGRSCRVQPRSTSRPRSSSPKVRRWLTSDALPWRSARPRRWLASSWSPVTPRWWTAGAGTGSTSTPPASGVVPDGVEIGPRRARVGDAVLISGDIGVHGIAVMSCREGLDFGTTITSDTAPLHTLVAEMLGTGVDVRVLRDPTRGGVSATLNEIAKASGVGIELIERDLPIPPEVKDACGLLGLDPLQVANEGKLLAIVPADRAEEVLAVMRQHPLGAGAARIGSCVAEHPGMVVARTGLGGTRVVDLPIGEQLPRIC